MAYDQLSADHQVQLRSERLLALEADHFRLSMALEEDPEKADAIRLDLDDLDRRAELHRRALAGVAAEFPARPVPEPEPVSESAATNGHRADAVHPR